MNRYRAHIKEIPGIPRIVDGPGFPVLKDGFWIDEEGKFTLHDGRKHWIPPSQIIMIDTLDGEHIDEEA